MNIVSIITFVVVGLYTGARGVEYAIVQQVGVSNSAHIVEPVPSYWYLGDTIRVTTYIIETGTKPRYKSDTTITAGPRKSRGNAGGVND